MTTRGFAHTLLGLSAAAFLVVGDIDLAPAWPWRAARLTLLGFALIAAALVVARRPRMLVALVRFPLVFFTAFAVLDLIASVVAERPLASLRYAAGLVAVEVMAVAVAETFTVRRLVVGLLATVGMKVVLSLALAGSPEAWWSATRFMGALGSPNPMGAAAGLAYLLIVLHGWYDWPRTRARAALALAGLVATVALTATRSVSATAATLTALVILTPVSRVREAGWRERATWAATAAVLLLPLLLVLSGGEAAPARLSTPAESIDLRAGWWAMLLQAISRQPWLGYGAGSTPWLGLSGTPPWGTSAHNLYLEAAIWAGIPAAIAMALFIVALLVAVARSGRLDSAARIGLAIPALFYTALSLVEPVLLNGAPSTLVVPLVIAAACATGTAARVRGGA
jgi:O-antigen ligase